MPPMMAAMKMMMPGVLTQEKEVVPALGEVLIWKVELNWARKEFTGATSLEVSSRNTKMRMKGSQAISAPMAGLLALPSDPPDTAPAEAAARISYSAGTGLFRRSRAMSTTQAKETTEPTITVSSGPMK